MTNKGRSHAWKKLFPEDMHRHKVLSYERKVAAPDDLLSIPCLAKVGFLLQKSVSGARL